MVSVIPDGALITLVQAGGKRRCLRSNQGEHDHSPPCVVVKKALPRSALPGAPAGTPNRGQLLRRRGGAGAGLAGQKQASCQACKRQQAAQGWWWSERISFEHDGLLGLVLPLMLRVGTCIASEGRVHLAFIREPPQCGYAPACARAPTMHKTIALLLAALVLLALPLGGWADGPREHDHDRARAALKAGEVLPLADILTRVARTHPGQVLEVELERDNGMWMYELKLLQSDGLLVKLKVDARDGSVVRQKRGKS